MNHKHPHIGRYVVIHTMPSAWYGYLLTVREANGQPYSCILADAALWTQGTTSGLIRPGEQMGNHMESSRLGLAELAGITAIQSAGSMGPVSKRPTTPAGQDGIDWHMVDFRGDVTVDSILAAANYKDTQDQKTFAEDEKARQAAVVKAVGDIHPNLPRRVVASILLHKALAYRW